MKKRFTLKSPLIKRNLPAIAVAIMLGTNPTATNAFTIISTRDGAWGDPMTWNCMCIPANTDDVFVFHTVSMSADYAVKSIHVEATGILNGNDKYSMSINDFIDVGGSYNVYKTILNNSDWCRIVNTSSDPYMFIHLEINKIGNDIDLKSHVQVRGNLTLIMGDLRLGPYNLTIGPSDSGIIIGGSTSSYIQADGAGRAIKEMDASTTLPNLFSFPVGDWDEYSPAILTMDGATYVGGDWIGVNLVDNKHPDELGINYVTRYWNWSSSGFASINYNLMYYYLDADIVGSESLFKSARWNNLSWKLFIGGDPAINMVMTDIGINTAPVDFDFTGSSGPVVMPIQLLSMDAEIRGENIVLTWSTASEVNNDFFTIERHQNEGKVEMLASLPGAGNALTGNNYSFVDNHPLSGTSYYRLKQTDYDGHTTQFDPIAVKYSKYMRTNIRVYPNPVHADQQIQVELQGFEDQKEVLVVLLNQYGVEVFSKVVIQRGDAILTAIDPKQKLAPGLYFVTGSNENNIYKQKLVIR